MTALYISTDPDKTDKEYTPFEIKAIDLVKTHPGLSVEELAAGDPDLYNAFYCLIFSGDLILDSQKNYVRLAV